MVAVLIRTWSVQRAIWQCSCGRWIARGVEYAFLPGHDQPTCRQCLVVGPGNNS
jgi:hypothetical protein